MDEPQTGRRPSDGELDGLVAIARTRLALRMAQDSADTLQHQKMLEGVLAVSARLAEADETDAVLQAVCDGIQHALGFDKVAIELAGRGRAARAGGRERLADRRRSASTTGLPLEARPLFIPEFEVAGCYLVPAAGRRRAAWARGPRELPLGDERHRSARLDAPLALGAPGARVTAGSV